MKKNLLALIFFVLTLFTLVPSAVLGFNAHFNPQINYQGRLVNPGVGTAVTDGTYHMRFKLYTTATGGAPIWTEDRSTNIGDRISLVKGLFSVMLGSSTPLTTVDFNQTLYLSIEVGGKADTPAWDGEMTPRKILGSVPSAFMASGLDAVNATSTNATTTNLFSTNSIFTNFLGTFSTTTSATSTNLFSSTASSTNLFSTNSNLSTLLFGSATGTVATTTNFFSHIGTFDDLYVNNYQQNDGTFTINSSVPTGDVFSVFDTAITNGTLIHQSLTSNAGNGQISKGQIIDLVDSTTAGGGYSALTINITGSGVGSGAKSLLDLNPGTNKEVVFDSTGALRPTTSASNNTNSIGTPSFYFKNGYFDTLTANNISGVVVSGATAATSWTIGSTQVGDVNEALIFQRNSGSGNALFSWNASNGTLNDQRYLSVNYPFNNTYTVDDTSIGTAVNLYSGLLTNNTTAGTQKLLSLTNTGTGATENGIYINNTGTGATALEIAGTWTTGILTNNNSINTGSGTITTTGLGTFGNLLATGSSTFQNITFLNSTSTNATTTSLFSTTASSTNLFSASAIFGNLFLSGSSTLQNFTYQNATGTQATTTSLFSTTGTFTNLVSTNQTFSNLTFILATGTSATTTNFFSTTASSSKLYAANFYVGGTSQESDEVRASIDGVNNAVHLDIGNINDSTGLANTVKTAILSFRGTNVKNAQFQFRPTLGNGTLVLDGSTDQSDRVANGSTIDLSLSPDGGSVGIGTLTPGATLDVAKNVKPEFRLSDLQAGGHTWSFTSGSSTKGYLEFTDMFTGATRLTIDTSGNVGIGKLLPSTALDVAGTASSTGLQVNGNGTFTGTLTSGLINSQTISSSANFTGTVTATGGLTTLSNLLLTGSSTLLNFTAMQSTSTNATTTNLYTSGQTILAGTSGNVGIGTTTPNNTLDIFAATKPAIGFGATSGSTNRWTMGIDTADGYKFKISSSTALGTSDRFTLDGNGNVGIGTTVPVQPLTISSSYTDAQLSIAGTTANNYTDMKYIGTGRTWYAGVGNGSETGLGVANKFFIYDQNASALRLSIDTNGAVNIGGTITSGLINSQTISSTANFTGTATIATSLTTPLHIGGTAVGSSLALQSTSGVGTTDFIKFLVGNNGGTEAMRIIDSGNVGIGTTTPAANLEVSSSNSVVLRVSRTGFANGIIDLVAGSSNGSIQVPSLFKIVTNSGDGFFMDSAQRSTFGDSQGGGSRLSVKGSVSIGSSYFSTTAPSSGAIIEGNVGIGTSAPNFKLEVSGVASTTDFFATRATTTNATSTNIFSSTASSTNLFSTNSNLGVVISGLINSQTISSTANFTGTATIATSLTTPLHIGGTAVGSSLALQSTSGVGTTDFIKFLVGNNGGTEAMRIIDSGNVGIGTTTPTSLLTVGAGTASLSAELGVNGGTNASRGSRLIFQRGGTTKICMGTAGGCTGTGNNDDFVVTSNSIEGLRVDQSGNVGIGTTGPGSKLELGGSYTTTGSVVVSGNATVSGGVQRGFSIQGSQIYAANNDEITGYLAAQTLTNGGSYTGLKNYGMYISNPGGTGTVATNYGLYVDSQTRGTTNYAAVFAGGNVGIGTATPSALLEVNKGSIGNAATEAVRIGTTNRANWSIGFNANNGLYVYPVTDDTSGANSQFFALTKAGQGTTRFFVDMFNGDTQLSPNGGNVIVPGIANCNPVKADGSGTLNCSSDERLKDISGTYATGLTAIDAINPILYTWKASSGLHSNTTILGFSAQNVESVIPQAVTYDARGFRQLNEFGILAASVNAIKELDTRTASTTLSLSALASSTDFRISALDMRVLALENSTSSGLTLDATSTEAINNSFFSEASLGLKQGVSGLGSALVSVFHSGIYAAAGVFDKVLARSVHTDLLCVTDSGGETCVTRTQLDAALAAGGQSGTLSGITSPPSGGNASSTPPVDGSASSTPPTDASSTPPIADSGTPTTP